MIKKFDEDRYFAKRSGFTRHYMENIYSQFGKEDPVFLTYLTMIMHRLIHILDKELTKNNLFEFNKKV